jgi:hypothetical protein
MRLNRIGRVCEGAPDRPLPAEGDSRPRRKSKRCQSAEAAASAATRGKRRELRGVEAEGTTLTGVQCGNSSGWQLLEEFERSEHRSFVDGWFAGTKKGGRINRPPLSRGSLAVLGLQFREAFEDERVGLIGDLGDEREVIPAEAVGVAEIPAFVHVCPGEGHVIELLLVGFVLPNGGFDPTEAESFRRQLGAGSRLGKRGGLSGLGGHIVPFFFDCEERDCSLAPRRGYRPGRGDGWGNSFQGGPERSLSA